MKKGANPTSSTTTIERKDGANSNKVKQQYNQHQNYSKQSYQTSNNAAGLGKTSSSQGGVAAGTRRKSTSSTSSKNNNVKGGGISKLSEREKILDRYLNNNHSSNNIDGPQSGVTGRHSTAAGKNIQEPKRNSIATPSYRSKPAPSALKRSSMFTTPSPSATATKQSNQTLRSKGAPPMPKNTNNINNSSKSSNKTVADKIPPSSSKTKPSSVDRTNKQKKSESAQTSSKSKSPMTKPLAETALKSLKSETQYESNSSKQPTSVLKSSSKTKKSNTEASSGSKKKSEEKNAELPPEPPILWQNGPYAFAQYYTLTKQSKNKNNTNQPPPTIISRLDQHENKHIDRFGFILEDSDDDDDELNNNEEDNDSSLNSKDDIGSVINSIRTEKARNTQSRRNLNKKLNKKYSNPQKQKRRTSHTENTQDATATTTTPSRNESTEINVHSMAMAKKYSYLRKLRKLRIKNTTHALTKQLSLQKNIQDRASTTSSVASASTAQTSMRYQKWSLMLSQWDRTTSINKSKLSRRLRKGIPDVVRGAAWSLLGNVPFSIESHPNQYYKYLCQANYIRDTCVMTIERDIRRTFPRHAFFCDNETNDVSPQKENENSDDAIPDLLTTKGGQACLRRVLRAYAIKDPKVGYCQGMNFIAAMFLTFMTEEEAFWLLVSVMNHLPCKMRHLFGEDMSHAHQVLHVGEKLIKHYLPKLHAHFEKENIHITMFGTQWLITIYTSSFKFELVTRVWDIFLYEGWKIVYRVMLSILDIGSKDMLHMNFEGILAYIKDIPTFIQEDLVMKRAYNINLKRKLIYKYEKEWMDMQGSSS